MRSITVWWLSLVCAAALSSNPAAALAADKTEAPARTQARDMAEAGAAAYQAGDYANAEERFSRAFELWPAPSLAFWAARSSEKLGKWLEAEARYREAESASIQMGDEDVQRSAQADAKQAREELAVRIPRISIRIDGANPADVTLSSDGKALARGDVTKPVPMNPGDHMILAEHRGERRVAHVSLSPGETRTVTLRFTPPPVMAADTSGDSTWRTAGWVSASVGAASLVASGVTALLALDKRDEFAALCPNDRCPDSVSGETRSDVDTYDTLRTVSTVTWITGAIVLAGGAAVLLTVKDEAPAGAELQLSLHPSSIQLGGRF